MTQGLRDAYKERNRILKESLRDPHSLELLDRAIKYTESTGNESAFGIFYNPFTLKISLSDLIPGTYRCVDTSGIVSTDPGSLLVYLPHTHPPRSTNTADDSYLHDAIMRAAGFDKSPQDITKAKNMWRDYLDLLSFIKAEIPQEDLDYLVRNIPPPSLIRIDIMPETAELNIYQARGDRIVDASVYYDRLTRKYYGLPEATTSLASWKSSTSDISSILL